MTKTALWVNGWSPPSWVKAKLKLIAKGSLQSRAGYAIRDWSQDTAHGNGTTNRAIAMLKNGLHRGISMYSYGHSTQMSYGDSGARGEPAYVIRDQGRSSQNGDHSALNNCGIPARSGGSFIKQKSGGIISQPIRTASGAETDTFRDQSRQNMAAELYKVEAQSAQPKYRWEAQDFAGFQRVRGHGNNIPQVEAQSPQTRAGAEKWREVTTMIKQNTGSLKVELERVGDTIPNDLLKIRDPKPRSREEERHFSARSERVTENFVRHDLSTENLLRNGLWMDGRSTPAWMKARLNLIAQSRLQSRSSYGRRVWSRDAERIGSKNLPRAGTNTEALAILKNHLQRGITVDMYMYADVLRRCSKQKDLITAKKVHDCVIQSGMIKNAFVASNLLNVYIKCGQLLDARQVFDEVEKKDVVTWNMMIAAYANYDNPESALELFKSMSREGVQPNEVTYLCILNACASTTALEWGVELHMGIRNAAFESDVRVATALLHMYANCGSITEARKVFDRMERRNLITWNTMISGLAQHGCGHEAYKLFCRMRREGFEPNAATYTSILNASASVGALQWVTEVHAYARKAGLETDLRVGTALVHMYAKSGSIDDALVVFDRMEKLDVVAWNAMIGGLAQHGCGHEALEYFREMNANGVKPDQTTFTAVLSACCHTGRLDDGRRLFSSMTQDYGIEPDIVQYNCMVDLLGRAGLLMESKLLMDEMPFEPDAVTWRTLLGACRTYGNVKLGELAAKELLKLEPDVASTYVLLSNIYAAAGNRDKQESVRCMMNERGVRKEPGRSWIQVGKKIHEFVVGDSSHPEAKAIHTMLKRLTENLKAEGYTPDIRLVLKNIDEADKESALCSHSEKLAIAYGLMRIPRKEPIHVFKNLRVCPDCHAATKLISKVTGREIIVRDAVRFHHFKDGVCSCGDYW